MDVLPASEIRSAEVVLPCADLAPTLAFFTRRLGFLVEAIFPAEAPTTAVVSGHGVRLRLAPGVGGAPGLLRLALDGAALERTGGGELVAPNGTRIELVDARPPVPLPPLRPSLALERLATARWSPGRAGMGYRDLVPDRQGGRFVASHIRIPEGGVVPDWVHYHRVRFQLIHCARGWVRVVYEDQGPPFVLRAGDCVLQPPEIRHRVLECSPGLEVVEVGCPALHATVADRGLDLPTAERRPERRFCGQRFVHHEARAATWASWRLPGFDACDTGIGEASGGRVGARVLRGRAADERVPASSRTARHGAQLFLLFVLEGTVALEVGAAGQRELVRGDSATLPAGTDFALTPRGGGAEALLVTSPADCGTGVGR